VERRQLDRAVFGRRCVEAIVSDGRAFRATQVYLRVVRRRPRPTESGSPGRDVCAGIPVRASAPAIFAGRSIFPERA
jgi:hypothetical protein